MAAVISTNVRPPKNAAGTRWILKSFTTIARLSFATESVSELFKLTYPNQFKNMLGYLNPVTFFHFAIPSD